MSCLSVPKIPAPDLSLFIPEFSIELPTIPSFGLDFCCNLQTPKVPLPIVPIDAIFALIASVAPAALDAILALISNIIDLLNALIDLIPPVNCPFD